MREVQSENGQMNVLLYDQILRSTRLFSSPRPYYSLVSVILHSGLESVDDGDDGLGMMYCDIYDDISVWSPSGHSEEVTQPYVHVNKSLSVCCL